MNVSHTVDNNNTAIINIELSQADLDNSYEKELKEISKTITLPGFRAGKVPRGIVEQKHGASVRYESLNKLVSDSLAEYMHSQKFEYYGSPMGIQDNTEQPEKSDDRKLSFKFELGLKPNVEVKIDKSVAATKYKVSASDKDIENEINLLRKRNGAMVDAETIGDNDLVNGDFAESNEDGTEMEGGVKSEEKSILMSSIKDADEKAKLLGKKVGDTIEINIFKVFDNNHTEISSIFGISKELVNDLNPNFKFTVKSIRGVAPAEMNEEFFAKFSTEETPVTNLEDLQKLLRKDIEMYYESRSREMLHQDIMKALVEAHQINLPDEFLLKWMKQNSKETPEHEIEHQYLHDKEYLKWSTIRDVVMKEQNIELDGEEINAMYNGMLRDFMSRYGYDYFNPAMRQEFETKYFKFADQEYNVTNMVSTQKTLDYITGQITVNEEAIDSDAFNKIRIERSKHEHDHGHDHSHDDHDHANDDHDHGHDHEHEGKEHSH